jgi:hypothetical protein
MTKIKMPAGKAGTVENHTEIITPNWRTALSAGNAAYNRNGNYWHEANPRRIRRALERAAKKAGARHG